MKNLLYHAKITLAFWAFTLAIFLGFNLAFGQPDGGAVLVPTNLEFNLLFLIPLVLGWVPHWLTKYLANKTTTPSVGQYLIRNFGSTIAGFMATFGAVTIQFQSNPAAFAAFNVGSFMMVLMTAWAADTVNSNFSSRSAPPPSGQPTDIE